MEYKWTLVKKYQNILALFYLSYMIVLSIYIEYFQGDDYFVAFLLIYGFLFGVLEIYQLYIRKTSYLKDFWNIFDAFRVVVLFFYCIVAFSSSSTSTTTITDST